MCKLAIRWRRGEGGEGREKRYERFNKWPGLSAAGSELTRTLYLLRCDLTCCCAVAMQLAVERMYKAAGRSFLVNGGAANNITHNLIVNGGEAIYNTNAGAANTVADLSKYDNGTLKRGDKGDYIWRTEQALGVNSYSGMLTTPLAVRFPTFEKIVRVNSSTAGWASPDMSNFQDNYFLNNSVGNICMLTNYHSPAVCDVKLAGDSALSRFVDIRGSREVFWDSFPGANKLEFVNYSLGFDTGGIPCSTPAHHSSLTNVAGLCF